MEVTAFIMLPKISILNKSCSFVLSMIKECWKKYDKMIPQKYKAAHLFSIIRKQQEMYK